MSAYRLPFTCQHQSYVADAKDGYGDITADWSEPVDLPCFWWPVSSQDLATAPTPDESVTADMALAIRSTVKVDHRDRFTVDGRRMDVVGLPKNYDCGPFGFAPNVQIVELKLVDP